MEKCKYCGKPYKLNNLAFLKALSPEIQEKLKYIPDCDCLEKEKQFTLEKLERTTTRLFKRKNESISGYLNY